MNCVERSASIVCHEGRKELDALWVSDQAKVQEAVNSALTTLRQCRNERIDAMENHRRHFEIRTELSPAQISRVTLGTHQQIQERKNKNFEEDLETLQDQFTQRLRETSVAYNEARLKEYLTVKADTSKRRRTYVQSENDLSLFRLFEKLRNGVFQTKAQKVAKLRTEFSDLQKQITEKNERLKVLKQEMEQLIRNPQTKKVLEEGGHTYELGALTAVLQSEDPITHPRLSTVAFRVEAMSPKSDEYKTLKTALDRISSTMSRITGQLRKLEAPKPKPADLQPESEPPPISALVSVPAATPSTTLSSDQASKPLPSNTQSEATDRPPAADAPKSTPETSSKTPEKPVEHSTTLRSLLSRVRGFVCGIFDAIGKFFTGICTFFKRS